MRILLLTPDDENTINKLETSNTKSIIGINIVSRNILINNAQRNLHNLNFNTAFVLIISLLSIVLMITGICCKLMLNYLFQLILFSKTKIRYFFFNFYGIIFNKN